MNNKKRIVVTALAALLLVAGATFTYAYFTDSKEQTNVITMGNVAIDLEEPLFSQNPNNTISNVLPNQEIVKDPTITLASTSNDAYVRTKITYTGDITEAQQAELEDGIAFANGWLKGTDGYYYYNTALTQTNNKVLVFGTVTIPETWGEEINGKTFNIVVKAEAIQKDNFTPATTNVGGNSMITGWLDASGTTITTN